MKRKISAVVERKTMSVAQDLMTTVKMLQTLNAVT